MAEKQDSGDRAGEEGSVQARVSTEIVRTMKELYGKGPTKARTYICDDNLFCVMKDGLTRNEETLIRGGEHEFVRDYRLRFQRLIAPEIIRRVEDIVGRRVLTYHSQILFDPNRLVEIFVLEEQADQ